LITAFLWFLHSQYSYGANTKLLGFSGFLMLSNILGMLFLILAFWFGYCNLIELMYVLVFYMPISLMLLNKGLAPENSNSDLL